MRCLRLTLQANLQGQVDVAPGCSDARDSFFGPVFAHTSPICVKAGLTSQEKRNTASACNDAIEGSLEGVRAKGRFYTDGQRQEAVD